MRIRLLLMGLIVLGGCGRAEQRQAVAVPVVPAVPVAAVPAESEPSESEEDMLAAESQLLEGDAPVVADESTFWQQAQRLYDQAKESGATTASSAAAWVAELYDKAATGTQTAAQSSADWVSEKYREATAAGETTATSTKEWVMNDLGRIGTWNYKVVEIRASSPNLIELELNSLGAQRWDCFAVRAEDQRTVLFLKRPHHSYLRQLPAKDLLNLVPLLHHESAPTQ